jgi:hypothetical protein
MQHLFKRLLILFILTNYGCQTHIWHPLSQEAARTSLQQKRAHNLLMQGKLYNNLDQQQQQLECKMLKQLYQAKANWQTAWLLVHSFNRDFNCISLQKKINLLKAMDTLDNSSIQLQWLNNNHLNLLTELNELKKLQGKNNSLRSQLKDTRKQLKKENSKIEALKEIETSINKKLDDE